MAGKPDDPAPPAPNTLPQHKALAQGKPVNNANPKPPRP
jgi:hypothetical protein